MTANSKKQKKKPGKTGRPTFVDQSSGKKFSDDSSSGSPLPADYILKQDFAQWL